MVLILLLRQTKNRSRPDFTLGNKMPTLNKSGFLSTEILKHVRMTRDKHVKWFNLCQDVNYFSHRVMFELKLHNEDPQEILVAVLFVKCMETFEAIILLIERGMVLQSKMLARCLLEALFKLGGLAKCPDLVPDYILSDELQRKKLLEKAKNCSFNPFGHSKNINYEQLLKDLKNEVKEKNIREITVKEFAEKAGLYDWYLTGYALLSDSIHSTPRDLQYYLNANAKQEIISLKWGPGSEGLDDILHMGINSLLLSIIAVVQFFKLNSNLENKVNQLVEKLKVLKQQKRIDNLGQSNVIRFALADF